jgi:hypothetical protein
VANRNQVTRLPTRSPPPERLQRETLPASFLSSLLADILGGEAEGSAAYMSSLPRSDRRRAAERREERAEAIHRLLRHILFWVDLLVAVVTMTMIVAIVTGLAWFLYLRCGITNVVLLLKAGSPPAFVGLGMYGLRLWRRRRRRQQKNEMSWSNVSARRGKLDSL